MRVVSEMDILKVLQDPAAFLKSRSLLDLWVKRSIGSVPQMLGEALSGGGVIPHDFVNNLVKSGHIEDDGSLFTMSNPDAALRKRTTKIGDDACAKGFK